MCETPLTLWSHPWLVTEGFPNQRVCWGRQMRTLRGHHTEHQWACGPSSGAWGCGWRAEDERQREDACESVSPLIPTLHLAADSGLLHLSQTFLDLTGQRWTTEFYSLNCKVLAPKLGILFTMSINKKMQTSNPYFIQNRTDQRAKKVLSNTSKMNINCSRIELKRSWSRLTEFLKRKDGHCH